MLVREKELTRARDELAAARRALPMVEVSTGYAFTGPDGTRTLLDLFDGRRQLVVYHFMFDPANPAPSQPSAGEGCVSCSRITDSIGHLAHLHARDTTLTLVSRAPIADLLAFRERMGWSVPWVSSAGSDFNRDMTATVESEFYSGEIPGVSVFLREGDRVFRTYWTTGRGLDHLLFDYNWLDLTPLGRQEGWGGTIDKDGVGLTWPRHHDRYGDHSATHCCGGS